LTGNYGKREITGIPFPFPFPFIFHFPFPFPVPGNSISPVSILLPCKKSGGRAGNGFFPDYWGTQDENADTCQQVLIVGYNFVDSDFFTYLLSFEIFDLFDA
jgi:hypothetical protein